MQLGAMGEQLRATGREEVAQPTHEHTTNCRDGEKKGGRSGGREKGTNSHLKERVRDVNRICFKTVEQMLLFVFLILILQTPLFPLCNISWKLVFPWHNRIYLI